MSRVHSPARRSLGPGALALLACASTHCATATRQASICASDRPSDPQKREPTNDEWVALLLRGQDRDCRGMKLEAKRLPDKCSEVPAEGDPLPLRPVTDEDVIVNRVDRNRRLVWIITERFSNGDGLGPLALAELGSDGIAIVALGTLRAMTDGVRLHLHPVGDGRKAGEIVTAEGEYCPSANRTTCRRSLVLMARRSTAFTNEHIEDPNGRCLGPAKIDLSRLVSSDIERGWKREASLAVSATYAPEGIMLHELVTIREFDPKRMDATMKEVKRAEDERAIKWTDGLLVVGQTALWDRVSK